MSQTQVLIIGAGISGLATAWWLAQRGITVEVWEKAQRPGGMIASHQTDGYLTEQAAALLVNFRPEVEAFIQQSGLSHARLMRPEKLKRHLLHQGRLQDVPLQLPRLLASGLWSTAGKLRLATEFLVPRGGKAGESVAAFARRRLGQEVLDTALDPFVAGTLGQDPERAEAASVLPRLVALEQKYGSISLGVAINSLIKRKPSNKADNFSFVGGMGQLIQAIASSPGISVRTGITVDGIEQRPSGWRVYGSQGGRSVQTICRQLVLCTPAPESARLLKSLSAEAARLLSGINYAPMGVLHLGLDAANLDGSLGDFSGFLVSRTSAAPFNGCLCMSRLFPGRAPEGKTLLSLYLGGARNPAQLEKSDAALAHEAVALIESLSGAKTEARLIQVDRHAQGLPLYYGKHRERIAQIDRHLSGLPGIALRGNYRDGVSVRECIHQGRLLTDKIAAGLEARRELTHPGAANLAEVNG